MEVERSIAKLLFGTRCDLMTRSVLVRRRGRSPSGSLIVPRPLATRTTFRVRPLARCRHSQARPAARRRTEPRQATRVEAGHQRHDLVPAGGERRPQRRVKRARSRTLRGARRVCSRTAHRLARPLPQAAKPSAAAGHDKARACSQRPASARRAGLRPAIAHAMSPLQRLPPLQRAAEFLRRRLTGHELVGLDNAGALHRLPGLALNCLAWPWQ